MLMRRFASPLVAMMLVLGLVLAPRQAAAIDDRWWFLDPPSESGEPDGPPPGIDVLSVMHLNFNGMIINFRVVPSNVLRFVSSQRKAHSR